MMERRQRLFKLPMFREGAGNETDRARSCPEPFDRVVLRFFYGGMMTEAEIIVRIKNRIALPADNRLRVFFVSKPLDQVLLLS